jgi:hypothetical protein
VEEVELEESAELAAVADTVEEVESDVVVEEVETAVVADAAEEPEQATVEVVDDLEQPEDEPA